mgnify:CR=1 FL=1
MADVSPTEGPFPGARDLGRVLPAAFAIGIHLVALWILAVSISFTFVAAEKPPEIVALVAVPPPPPLVRELGPTDAIMTMPLFRPRVPLGLSVDQVQRFGDPALAVWKYLCNRDDTLAPAVRRNCPAPAFGSVDMDGRAPLNRQGDSGVMLGAETRTMSLQEAGVARGWIKKPPARGQSGLAGKTDTVNQPDGPEIYKSLPSLKHEAERAPDAQ